MKEIGLMRLTDFKLLCQMGRKSIKNCDFFVAIVISVRGGHCNYSRRPPKKILSLRNCSSLSIVLRRCVNSACQVASSDSWFNDKIRGNTIKCFKTWS